MNKRVDKCLVNLLKFLRDKYFERLVKLTEGRSCKKLKDINDRHSQSMQMSTDCVVEVESRKWKVRSKMESVVMTLSSSVNHVQIPVVCYRGGSRIFRR